MAIPHTIVVATLVDPAGDPLEGVTITAELTSAVVYENIIVPLKEQAVTNRSGSATFQLTPNTLSGTTNTYTFTIQVPGVTPPLIYYDVVVPQSADPVTLQQLLGWESEGPISQIYWAAASYWTGDSYWF